ncbi:MAG: hypothetical protein HOV83_14875 [Catenulispora sp.]|nr:hypothetical protein [Catenulispora sp.]
MAGYQADDQPAQLVLPGVRGADGAIVLADGNHRACAAYAAKVDLRLFLFVIDGPADERTLPDLIHHAGRAG